MRTLDHTLYYPHRGHVFTLYYLTDMHIGALACAEKLLKSDIEQIAADPNAYWIGGGDYVDAICQVGDKRYKPSTLSRWLLGEDDPMDAQARYAVDMLKPIAGKCLGLVKGNHEWGAETFYARNLYWDIVRGIADAAGKAPESLALGIQGFIRIRFRRGTPEKYGGSWVFTIYAHHGFGGGRLPGGHALTIGRVLGDYFCDLAMMGHRHTEVIVPKTVTSPTSGGGVEYHKRVGMFVPSYLNSYIIPSSDKKPFDTYAEKVGLPPTPLGTIPVYIQPDARRIDTVTSNSAGIAGRLVQPRFVVGE